MRGPVCRACRGQAGELVLDLGEQPACDYFPRADDPGPDPVYPLQMWLCSACGLAQLVADPTVPEEPRGAEPAALVAQAADAVARVDAAGMLAEGGRVTEYGSPHGGSWLDLLGQRGLTPVPPGEPADVVLDCFGLMHAADQSAALAERVARVAPGGVLLLQYHSLDAIIRGGQWNALRHGHYAYYSAAALSAMLAAQGFSARRAWQFELYGGTVLLAACWDGDPHLPPMTPCGRCSARRPRPGSATRPRSAACSAMRGPRRGGCTTGLSPSGRPGIPCSATVPPPARSPCCAGRKPIRASSARSPMPRRPSRACRMPGTDIPVVSPARLADYRPSAVVLFVADLLPEVRAAFPEVEAAGGRWVDAEVLGSIPARG